MLGIERGPKAYAWRSWLNAILLFPAAGSQASLLSGQIPRRGGCLWDCSCGPPCGLCSMKVRIQGLGYCFERMLPTHIRTERWKLELSNAYWLEHLTPPSMCNVPASISYRNESRLETNEVKCKSNCAAPMPPPRSPPSLPISSPLTVAVVDSPGPASPALFHLEATVTGR